MAETLLQQAFDKSRESLISAICKLKRAKRLEYVESDGNQYVDTGLTQKSGMSCSIKFVWKGSSTQALFGGRTAPYSSNAFGCFIDKTSIYPLYAAYQSSVTQSVSANVLHEIEIGENSYFDGVLIRSASGSFSGLDNILIFTLTNGSSIDSRKFVGQIYSCDILDNGVLVRDYIPVKDSAGVAGLLDLVSGQIFYSATSTALIAGPEATPYFSRIEYLESTNTTYIDSNIIPSDSDEIELIASLPAQTTSTPAFFGNRKYTTGDNGIVSWWDSSSFWCYAFGNSSSSTASVSMSFTTGTPYAFKINKDGIFINGTKKTTFSSYKTPSTTTPIWIFAINNGGSHYNPRASYRLFAFTIKQNNTIVRDFIPVRLGTTGYLYDKVTKQLFGNAGTGSFVLGPDVA